MSYAVGVGGESLNYTSNMRALFADFGVYPPEWDGRPRREVGAEIGKGLRAMVFARQARGKRAFDRKYDAPNGWGSVDSAMRWLLAVYLECFRELPDTVSVWW
jgi:hypothetical protein